MWFISQMQIFSHLNGFVPPRMTQSHTVYVLKHSDRQLRCDFSALLQHQRKISRRKLISWRASDEIQSRHPLQCSAWMAGPLCVSPSLFFIWSMRCVGDIFSGSWQYPHYWNSGYVEPMKSWNLKFIPLKSRLSMLVTYFQSIQFSPGHHDGGGKPGHISLTVFDWIRLNFFCESW